jgi:hypothetical protein
MSHCQAKAKQKAKEIKGYRGSITSLSSSLSYQSTNKQGQNKLLGTVISFIMYMHKRPKRGKKSKLFEGTVVLLFLIP